MARDIPPNIASAVSAALVDRPRAAILVEGQSDQAAVRTLAKRRGRDLAAEGVAVVALDGITNLKHFLSALEASQKAIDLVGLYDEPEVAAVRAGLRASGIAAGDDLALHGFHVCRRDLEDELIRALGVEAVLRIFEQDGQARRFVTFQRQPAQRGRPIEAHVHRFLGIRSGRKVRYGRLLVEGLDLAKVPAPLDAVLAAV